MLKNRLPLLAAAMSLLMALPADALINVSFTPVDLAKSAEAIVLLEGVPDAAGGKIRLKTVKVLKGKDMDIAAVGVGDLAESDTLAAELKKAKVAALLFAGKFEKAKEGATVSAIGALHIGTSWYALTSGEDGGHELVEDPLDLKAVWDGGTEPLCRAMEYALKSRAPVVPVASGVKWRAIVSHGKIAGGVGEPACLIRDGRPELIFTSPQGDTIVNVAADGKLRITAAATKSIAATYVDLDQDGTPNRVGCDGKALYFLDDPAKPTEIVKLEGASEIMPATHGGKPAILATLPKGPQLIWKEGNGYLAKAIGQEGPDGIQRVRLCDVTGDGIADLLMFHERRLLVGHGKADGSFESPRQAAGAPESLRDVKLADFDGDGRLDILLAGGTEAGLALLAGDGKGGFTQVIDETGELVYHGTGAMSAALVSDFNNDGLQDVVLLRKSGVPMLMFNRGFRTFGFSRNLDFGTLDLPGAELIRGTDDNQVQVTAGALVDLDGDGGLDLLCVANGQLVAVMREAGTATLGVRLTLAPELAGPVQVTVANADRNLGTVLLDSSRPQFFGTTAKGPVDVSWTFPDGTKGSKRVIVLKPIDLVIGKD